MKNYTFTVETTSQLPEVARQLINITSFPQIICFQGEMGVGKTTFIKAALNELGCGDEGNSPTYSVINEHTSPQHGKIFHLDLYRIQSIEEAFDLGIEDILYEGTTAFIEWPEIIRNLLPPNHVWITIQTDEVNQQRIISMSV